MTWLIGLAASALGPKYERFAKPLVFVALALIALLALGTAKCAYDHHVIVAHEAKQDAANAKADRKADAHAADQRRTDDARTADESTQIKEAIDEAKRTGADPRAAYYECVRRQQAARAGGRPSPDC